MKWVSDKHNFIMYTSTKCGNTTLREWFMQYEVGMTYDDLNTMRIQSRIYRDGLTEYPDAKYYRFAVTRDIYARCVSMYMDKVRHNFDRYAATIIYEGATFDEFLDALVKEYENCFASTDPHFAPQVDYIDCAVDALDLVIDLKALNAGMSWVFAAVDPGYAHTFDVVGTVTHADSIVDGLTHKQKDIIAMVYADDIELVNAVREAA